MGDLESAICSAKSDLRRIADELKPDTVIAHILELGSTVRSLAEASGALVPVATTTPAATPAVTPPEVLTSPEPGQMPPPA